VRQALFATNSNAPLLRSSRKSAILAVLSIGREFFENLLYSGVPSCWYERLVCLGAAYAQRPHMFLSGESFDTKMPFEFRAIESLEKVVLREFVFFRGAPLPCALLLQLPLAIGRAQRVCSNQFPPGIGQILLPSPIVEIHLQKCRPTMSPGRVGKGRFIRVDRISLSLVVRHSAARATLNPRSSQRSVGDVK
jgi:hypothetical protein